VGGRAAADRLLWSNARDCGVHCALTRDAGDPLKPQLRATWTPVVRATLLSCTAVAACALPCARARADEPAADAAAVQLSIPDCAEIAGAEITGLVALELAPKSSPAAGATPPEPTRSPTRAALRCTGLHATVTVASPERATPLVLELDLTDTKSEARPRFLALAIAELIATSRLEQSDPRTPRTPPRPPPAPPAPPAPRAPDVAPEPPATTRLELSAAAGASRGFDPALFAPALALGAAQRWSALALGVELTLERAQSTTTQAVATAHAVSLGASPAWRVDAGPLDFGFSLGVRGGHAWLAGTPRRAQLSGHTLTGFYLAPIAGSVVQLRVTAHWAARLALECGYVLTPIRGLDADRAALLALRGLRTSGMLGMTWMP
jgi:hypothetical protein